MYTDKKLIFNGFDFSAVLAVEEVRRTLLPPLQTQQRERVGGRSTLITQRFGAAIVEVDVRMFGKSEVGLLNLMREIAGKLWTETPVKLETDDTGRWDMAVLDGETEVERFFEIGGTTLRFLCPESLSFGAADPVSFSGSKSFSVGGTAKTKAVFEVRLTTGTTSVKLSNQRTGKFLEVTGNFVIGNVIEFDCIKETVKLNGNIINAQLNWMSDYFELLPGINNLLLSTGSCVMTYFTRWI